MKTTIIAIVALIVGVAIGFSIKEEPKDYQKVMWYYDRYYNAAEEIIELCPIDSLDSLNYDYETAKEDLLISLEEDI